MNIKEWIKNISLVFIALFIVIGLSEIALRVFGYNYIPIKIEAMNKRLKKSDWREYHLLEDNNFIYDPILIWRPKKNHSVFNSQGLRGRDIGPKGQDEIRIFTIGDSNTLGWGGEKDSPNWPMYLENILRESSDRFTVVNAGVWGYTSFQGVRRFKEVLSYEPDVVTISFGGNDAHQVVFSDAEYLERRSGVQLYKIFLSHFRTGQLMIAFYDKFLMPMKRQVILVPRVSLDEYRKNLIEIIEICKEKKIICILLTRPFIGSPPDELDWKNFGPAYVKATIEVAHEYNIPVVNIYSYFKDKEHFFIDDSHFTKTGYMIAAALVYESIQPFFQQSLKKLNLEGYVDNVFGNINTRGIIVPKKIDPAFLIDFDTAYVFTDGDSRIVGFNYNLKPDDRFLVLNTFGFDPFRDDLERLNLSIYVDGIRLQFSHKQNNSYYFILDKRLKSVHEIRITSSTFVPKELGINNDSRTLGIDVASIEFTSK